MENSLIRDIMNLSHDIYSMYKEPKFFKLKPIINIKKWRVKHKLDKFEKEIIKIINNCDTINYKALIDYFSYIGLSYPPKGNYRHTDMIKSNDLEYEFGVSYSFSLNHKDNKYICQALIGYQKENNSINIIYTCKDKGKNILEFTDEKINKFLIKNDDTLNPELYEYNLDQEGNIIRNEFIKSLLNDIKEFLVEKIEFYKERINSI